MFSIQATDLDQSIGDVLLAHGVNVETLTRFSTVIDNDLQQTFHRFFDYQQKPVAEIYFPAELCIVLSREYFNDYSHDGRDWMYFLRQRVRVVMGETVHSGGGCHLFTTNLKTMKENRHAFVNRNFY